MLGASSCNGHAGFLESFHADGDEVPDGAGPQRAVDAPLAGDAKPASVNSLRMAGGRAVGNGGGFRGQPLQKLAGGGLMVATAAMPPQGQHAVELPHRGRLVEEVERRRGDHGVRDSSSNGSHWRPLLTSFTLADQTWLFQHAVGHVHPNTLIGMRAPAMRDARMPVPQAMCRRCAGRRGPTRNRAPRPGPAGRPTVAGRADRRAGRHAPEPRHGRVELPTRCGQPLFLPADVLSRRYAPADDRRERCALPDGSVWFGRAHPGEVAVYSTTGSRSMASAAAICAAAVLITGPAHPPATPDRPARNAAGGAGRHRQSARRIKLLSIKVVNNDLFNGTDIFGDYAWQPFQGWCRSSSTRPAIVSQLGYNGGARYLPAESADALIGAGYILSGRGEPAGRDHHGHAAGVGRPVRRRRSPPSRTRPWLPIGPPAPSRSTPDGRPRRRGHNGTNTLRVVARHPERTPRDGLRVGGGGGRCRGHDREDRRGGGPVPRGLQRCGTRWWTGCWALSDPTDC